NKLKLGHLRGNRFRIRVREVLPEALPACRATLQALQARGLPNRFGEQRFGQRSDTHLLGRLALVGDPEALVRHFLGGPSEAESPTVQEARRRFEANQWVEALAAFPGAMSDERAALEALIRSSGDFRQAAGRIPKRLRRFFVSAYQSYLFNAVLEHRMPDLDRLQVGDLAMKHENGAVFLVQDAVVEQPRADRQEISPSGPLFGHKMTLPEGEPGHLEQAVLAAEGLTLDAFRIGEGLAPKGARRALRVPLQDVAAAWDGGIVLEFSLPPGSYATVLLGEVMKCPLV
ncbi:MAG: tRNA pseudouridine(13) synthase TruD, partial [Chloroflexi bacterium]|nr:tRNA pseudouridine(13) synthase TruD [Chloroflexota bacterium]